MLKNSLYILIMSLIISSMTLYSVSLSASEEHDSSSSIVNGDVRKLSDLIDQLILKRDHLLGHVVTFTLLNGATFSGEIVQRLSASPSGLLVLKSTRTHTMPGQTGNKVVDQYSVVVPSVIAGVSYEWIE